MNRFKGLYCSPQGPDAFEILSAILEMRHVDEKTHELSTGHVQALHLFKNKFFCIYSRVSFCDGPFYDDSLLWPMSSRTEHSPLGGASLSQLKRPFSTYCASSSFQVCMCFFFFYFSAVLLSWLWFFHPWHPPKRQKRRKNQNSWCYILSWCLLNHGLGFLQQNNLFGPWTYLNLNHLYSTHFTTIQFTIKYSRT